MAKKKYRDDLNDVEAVLARLEGDIDAGALEKVRQALLPYCTQSLYVPDRLKRSDWGKIVESVCSSPDASKAEMAAAIKERLKVSVRHAYRLIKKHENGEPIP